MGNSESTTSQVSKVVMETEKNSKCTCEADSENSIGDINMTSGACCPSGINVEMSAKASCDCDMKSAIETLSAMTDSLSASSKSSLSFALSSSDATQMNEENVKQTLNDQCHSTASAKQSIKEININQTGSCCGATAAQLKVMKDATRTFKMSSSAQGKCLLSIASKMASDMENEGNNSSSTTDPISAALTQIMDAATDIFGDYVEYIGIAVVGLIVMLLLITHRGKTRTVVRYRGVTQVRKRGRGRYSLTDLAQRVMKHRSI